MSGAEELRALVSELKRLVRACEDGAKGYEVGSPMHAHALGLAMGYRRAAEWILAALGEDIGCFAPSPLTARAAALKGSEEGTM